MKTNIILAEILLIPLILATDTLQSEKTEFQIQTEKQKAAIEN